MFLGKVESGIRQLQRTVVAVLPVCVSYTLQYRDRSEGNGAKKRMMESAKETVNKPGRREERDGDFLAGAGTVWHV